MIFSLSTVLTLVLVCLNASPVAALTREQAESIVGKKAEKNGLITAEYDGISLIALNPPTEATFDVPITDGPDALKVITSALSLIENTSPFLKSKIERLKQRGPVTIVYDPTYPDRLANMGSVQVALFSPHFFKKLDDETLRKTFLVIVSRHGVKWPVEELAAVMVHELVGHGTQHLNFRWGDMRLIDMECEAWLYEEMAYQKLGVDKFSNTMIDFKKQLERQCDGFLRHLRNNDQQGLEIWNNLNPEVPKLLTHFERYLGQLKK